VSFLVEQTPATVGEIDESAIHHHAGRWRPTPVDQFWLTAEHAGLGQDASCPPCSYHHEGRCTWCPEDPTLAEEIPECAPCEGRKAQKQPWYKREDIMIPVLTTATVTVIATVLSTIILRRIGMKEA
jgi:hypothetical protein